ncbi:hypothetical protein BDP27DRAFT_1331754, partial [Rhodocollybia butyracea]
MLILTKSYFTSDIYPRMDYFFICVPYIGWSFLSEPDSSVPLSFRLSLYLFHLFFVLNSLYSVY